jgi:asparagine synthase (glutamine-hydrolysing)
LDEPTLGTGALPQFVVAELVRRHAKVVLTGHGGDELFAGYQVFKAILLRDLARTSPRHLLRALASIRRDEWSRVLYYLIAPVLYPEVGLGLFIMTAKRQRHRVFHHDFMQRVAGFDPLAAVHEIGADAAGLGDFATALYLKTYLPTLLRQEDRMGMAHAIEARMPLCDNEFVDFGLQLTLRQKLAGGTLKAVPRRAMQHRLPPYLYSLPKRGFPTPFARWFRRDPVRGTMEDLLLSRQARERGILRPDYVAKLWRRNTESIGDTLADYARANRLYAIATVELWFRTFIDRHDLSPL